MAKLVLRMFLASQCCRLRVFDNVVHMGPSTVLHKVSGAFDEYTFGDLRLEWENADVLGAVFGFKKAHTKLRLCTSS